jgi:hypothetical protein
VLPFHSLPFYRFFMGRGLRLLLRAAAGASCADATSRASLWKRKHVLVFGGYAAKNQYMFSQARHSRATCRRKGRLCM